MPATRATTALQFLPADPSDLPALTELRLAAMRPSLEAIGRYDPDRVRMRLAQNFDPSHTTRLVLDGRLAGFYATLECTDCLWLNHLYIHPEFQSAGLGTATMARIQHMAALLRKPIFLHALRQSPSNRFYESRGFTKVADLDFDHLHEWPPAKEGYPGFLLRLVQDPQEKSTLCADTLATLPQWFGVPESTAAYVRDVATRQVWAIQADGQTAGFISMQDSSPVAQEIHVVGLKPAFHRKGLCTRALRYLSAEARLGGKKFLVVKTLAESAQSPEYDRTRAFYQKNGFDPLVVEPELWNAENPCLIMVKVL